MIMDCRISNLHKCLLLLLSTCLSISYVLFYNSTTVNLVRYSTSTRYIEDPTTVQLVFTVNDYEACHDLVTSLKSILYSRTTPLHLHIFVNPSTKPVVDTLFKTSKLEMFTYTFYISKTFKKVADIILYQIQSLPTYLNYVIVLDTKVVVFGDIGYFWHYTQKTNSNSDVIGMVDYCNIDNVDIHNIGVLLINLNLLRAHSNITSLSRFLANNLVYKLPCNWNVNSECSSLPCDSKNNEHMIWQRRDNGKNFIGDSLKMFQQLEGYSLGHKQLRDNTTTNTPRNVKAKEMCAFYKNESRLMHQTHLYFHWNSYTSKDKWDVTLLLQFSFNRLKHLELVLSHWDGPVSAAVYVSDYEALQLKKYLEKTLLERKNVAVHVVYKQGTLYPVNYLRNVALNQVQTPFVFLSDFDFVPMKGLYSYLKSAVQTMQGNKHAFVIPAYESLKYNFTFPKDKKRLVQMVRRKQLNSFHLYKYEKGHAPTNFKKWESTNVPYDIKYGYAFEPYVVVRSNVTRYDERFLGFGLNKVSQIYELHMQGYRFTVLPKGFVIHSPHPPSEDFKSMWSNKAFKDCVKGIWAAFRKELQQKYKRSS